MCLVRTHAACTNKNAEAIASTRLHTPTERGRENILCGDIVLLVDMGGSA